MNFMQFTIKTRQHLKIIEHIYSNVFQCQFSLILGERI